MTEPVLRFYHRVDDPWSHLLLQLLPALQRSYAVRIECITVPLAPPAYSPRPQLLAAHALRDVQDLCRYYRLEFVRSGRQPSEQLVAKATRRLLAVTDTSQYIGVAQALGAALFAGDDAQLEAHCDAGPSLTADEAECRLQANQQRQLGEGHFHGGMLAFGGNWYWGIDRLAHLEHDLLVAGARRPNACVGLLERRPDSMPSAPGQAPHAQVPLEIEFFCTFRSPYAYLAAQRTFALQRDYPVRVRPRLMLPMKMAGFVIPESKALYFRFDPAREALRLGIRFGNFCDPFGPGLERAMALVEVASAAGQLPAYLLSVMQGVWADGLDLATDDGLCTCVERAGLDWPTAVPHLQDDGWRVWAKQNRDALVGIGQYAAPTYKLGDYVTWGQDRIPLLEREIRRRLAFGPAAEEP